MQIDSFEFFLSPLLCIDSILPCEQKNCEVQELNVQADHVHMILLIPPKVSISDMMGVLKGQTAIRMFRKYPNLKKKPYWGNHFCVDTVSLNEEMIRTYVHHQEKQDNLNNNVLS